MAKLMMALGVLLVGVTSMAGALPYELYSCNVKGLTADGKTINYLSGGFSEKEAVESAMYRCEEARQAVECELVGCSWETVRPRPR